MGAGRERGSDVEVEVEVEVVVGVEGDGNDEGGENAGAGKGVHAGFAAGLANLSVCASAGVLGGDAFQAMAAGESSVNWSATGAGGSDSMEIGAPGSRGLSAKQRMQRSASGGKGCEQRWQTM